MNDFAQADRRLRHAVVKPILTKRYNTLQKSRP